MSFKGVELRVHAADTVIDVKREKSPKSPKSPARRSKDFVEVKLMRDKDIFEDQEAGRSVWQGFLRDVVRQSVGIVAAEIWLRNSSASSSASDYRPIGGWYLEPSFSAEEESVATALNLISEQPEPSLPNTGLVGQLWDEAVTHRPSAHGGRRVSKERLGAESLGAPWQSLMAIAQNEDAPDDARTNAAAAVFGSVSALPLMSPTDTTPGVMLLFARVVPAGHSRPFEHAANRDFLLAATRIGGAIAAAEQSRRVLIAAKRARSSAMNKLRALHRSGLLASMLKKERERLETGESVIKEGGKEGSKRAQCTHAGIRILAWVKSYLAKAKGARGARAPSASGLCARVGWETAGWTLCGVATTLLGLSALNQWVLQLTDDEHQLLIGSFGALMTLLYGAPASPLAQPRNVILGSTIASAVAVTMFYLSGEDFLGVVPPWVMQALAPAIAIALMQRVALLHPPAGAASLIFVSSAKMQSASWMYLVLPLLVGNLFCVLVATFFNNLSRQRQYPLWW